MDIISMMLASRAAGTGGSSGGVSSWNDLTDKPFYEEETEVYGDTLTWDFNALPKIEFSETMIVCRISDATPTVDEANNGGSYIGKDYGITGEIKTFNFTGGGNVEVGGFLSIGGKFICVPEEKVGVPCELFDGAIFQEAGLYTWDSSITSLTINGYNGFKTVGTVVKKLDKKYLPEALQFGEEVQIVNEPLNITWDGNTEGLVSVGDMYFKVSDAVLTIEQYVQIRNGEIHASISIGGGEMMDLGTFGLSPNENRDAFSAEIVIFALKSNATLGNFVFPEPGIYFAKVDENTFASAMTTDFPLEQTKVVTKKLDAKYLPTEYINALIDTKLGVIENGTY